MSAEQPKFQEGDKVRILPSEWAIVHQWVDKQGKIIKHLGGIWYLMDMDGKELFVIDRELKKEA